jgi:hypothetical protein
MVPTIDSPQGDQRAKKPLAIASKPVMSDRREGAGSGKRRAPVKAPIPRRKRDVSRRLLRGGNRIM